MVTLGTFSDLKWFDIANTENAKALTDAESHLDGDTMNIDGIVTKIEANADKIGMLAGFMVDPMAGGRGLDGAIPFIIDRVTHWKLPTVQTFTWAFTHPASPYREGLKTAVFGYIGGEILEWFGQGRYGKALKEGAVGFGKGLVIGAAALLPATQSSPPNPNMWTGNGGSSGSALGNRGYAY